MNFYSCPRKMSQVSSIVFPCLHSTSLPTKNQQVQTHQPPSCAPTWREGILLLADGLCAQGVSSPDEQRTPKGSQVSA